MPAPSKTEQEAESEARAAAGNDPALNAKAIDVPDDGPRGDPNPDPQGNPQGQKEAAKPTPTPPPSALKRADIISRWNADRRVEEDAAREDVSDFQRSGMPPEFEPEPEPPAADAAPPAEVEATPPPAPPKIKLKVHGKEIEVSQEELVADAQRFRASENILEEVKALKKDLTERLKVTPADPAARPAAEPSGQSPQPPASPTGEVVLSDQEDPILKLIETMQFGDTAQAKELLTETIQRIAAKAADESLQVQRLRDEGARTAKVLSDFRTKHPDIASDPLADAAIQTRMYQLQVSDIEALGIDPTKIQTPSGVVTPADIAMAHRWYRSNGYNVRTPQDMLETATADFLQWKGIKPTETPVSSSSTIIVGDKAPPRVEVDRGARREAIPQQPSRTAVPRQAAPPAPAVKDRSDIVRNEIARRNLPRGKAGIA